MWSSFKPLISFNYFACKTHTHRSVFSVRKLKKIKKIKKTLRHETQSTTKTFKQIIHTLTNAYIFFFKLTVGAFLFNSFPIDSFGICATDYIYFVFFIWIPALHEIYFVLFIEQTILLQIEVWTSEAAASSSPSKNIVAEQWTAYLAKY